MKKLFDFSEALNLLKAGYKVRREAWKEDLSIYLRKPKGKMGAFFVVQIGPEKFEPYNPDTMDLLATDWSVVLDQNASRSECDEDAKTCKAKGSEDKPQVKIVHKTFDNPEDFFDFLDSIFK